MHPNRTHEMRVPTPEHQSIFTDTYHGVPNPQVPHEHPYPTRFHGPVYGVPRFGLPYRKQSWQVPSGLPGKAPTGGCVGCSGFGVDVTAGASIDSSGVDMNVAVDLGGGKMTTRSGLVKAVIEIVEKRAGTKLDTSTSAALGLLFALSPSTFNSCLAVLAAAGFERKAELAEPMRKQFFAAAAAEWTKAKNWINIAYNTRSKMIPFPSALVSSYKALSSLYGKFAAEDLAGGPPKARRLLTAVRSSSTVLDLVSTSPVPTQAPPQTKMIEMESSMTPWLILGGVAVVGTAGYLYWRSQKKSP